MTTVLDHDKQMLIVDAVCHAAQMAGYSIQVAYQDVYRPSVLYRPRLFLDGDKHCALYGDDIMSGCAGFGSTPDEAMADFDANWKRQAPTPKGSDQ